MPVVDLNVPLLLALAWRKDNRSPLLASFVAEVQRLSVPPNLIILVSCNTAGDGAAAVSASDGGFLSLGPRLIRAGVPAVLAIAVFLRSPFL